jgi:hypothetical protein
MQECLVRVEFRDLLGMKAREVKEECVDQSVL